MPRHALQVIFLFFLSMTKCVEASAEGLPRLRVGGGAGPPPGTCEAVWAVGAAEVDWPDTTTGDAIGAVGGGG